MKALRCAKRGRRAASAALGSAEGFLEKILKQIEKFFSFAAQFFLRRGEKQSKAPKYAYRIFPVKSFDNAADFFYNVLTKAIKRKRRAQNFPSREKSPRLKGSSERERGIPPRAARRNELQVEPYPALRGNEARILRAK